MGWFTKLQEWIGGGMPEQATDDHACAWCGRRATLSRKYKDFDLVFPVCGDTECHGALDRFLGNSACYDIVAGWMSKFDVVHSMGIPQQMKEPEFVRRIERLRKYVRMQRE